MTVGANELINITILSRQQRGNPVTMLYNHKKVVNTIIQNRYWFASLSARYYFATNWNACADRHRERSVAIAMTS